MRHGKKICGAVTITLILGACFNTVAQNVGIGTNQPLARLHVADSAVLFTGLSGTTSLPIPYPLPPVQGTGVRMMWYPGKSAFRAGSAVNEWDKDSIGLYSTAFGFQTKAKGSYAVSMGNSTAAIATNSTSLGAYTIASGANSISSGFQTVAIGEASTSMGVFTRASGNYSTSLGQLTTASGITSTSMGVETEATGYASTSMGRGTVASGVYSTSIGLFTVAKANSGFSMGSYNDNTDNPNSNLNATDRVFQIGNGNGNSFRSNAITVLRNGNMGIGVLNPGYILDVNGRMRLQSNNSLSAGINLNNEANTSIAAFMGMRSTDNELGFYGYTGTAGWRYLVNTTTGDAWLQGTLTQNSDVRLKTNIEPLSKTLQSIQQINGYTYNWKDKSNPDEQIGLLAQELKKVYPQLVKENANGELSVNYSGMVPVLLEAIKELQQRVAQLEEKLK